MCPELTLLDFFAATANEEDIQAVKHLVQSQPILTEGFDGRKHLQHGLPKDWRQQARYFHAQAMMTVSRKIS